MRKLSAKQVRYLWAVGFFKRTGQKTVPSQQSYKKIVSQADAEAYLEKNHPNDIEGRLKEGSGLYAYRSPAYATMNAILRGSQADLDTPIKDTHAGLGLELPMTYTYRDALRDIDTLFKQHAQTTKEPIVLSRGLRDEFARQTRDMIDRGEITVGSEIIDKAYLSTSVSSGGGWSGRPQPGLTADEQVRDQVHVNLKIPAGTKVLPGNRNQTELILDRGLKFRVDRIETYDDQTRKAAGFRDAEIQIKRHAALQKKAQSLPEGSPERSRVESMMLRAGMKTMDAMSRPAPKTILHLSLIPGES